MMGVSPAQMVESVIQAGADVIGTNCGNGMKDMIEIVSEIREVDPNTPILVHANAGKPEMQAGKTVFPESPEDMASFISVIVNAGANIVGGCCGTTPEHIQKIAQTVNFLR
jgi:5-methyltetrahydrofolate--homocysteine methyltransferase